MRRPAVRPLVVFDDGVIGYIDVDVDVDVNVDVGVDIHLPKAFTSLRLSLSSSLSI